MLRRLFSLVGCHTTDHCVGAAVVATEIVRLQTKLNQALSTALSNKTEIDIESLIPYNNIHVDGYAVRLSLRPEDLYTICGRAKTCADYASRRFEDTLWKVLNKLISLNGRNWRESKDGFEFEVTGGRTLLVRDYYRMLEES